MEQHKLQSDEKEKRLTERLAKMQLQLNDKIDLIESLQYRIESLREEANKKDDKLKIATKELKDQTEKLRYDLMEKEMALDDAKSDALRSHNDDELRINTLLKKKEYEMRCQVEELEAIARQAELQK
eukprot:15341880-Ditylum_brightwellii.AAC.1